MGKWAASGWEGAHVGFDKKFWLPISSNINRKSLQFYVDLWLLFKNWARRVYRAGSPTCEQWAGVMAQVPLDGSSSSAHPVWPLLMCRWLAGSLGSWELLASSAGGGGWEWASSRE